MVPKANSTKNQTPKKQVCPYTLYLRDEDTEDESSGTIEEYPLEEVVELSKSLPQGSDVTLSNDSPLRQRRRIKNLN